MSWEWISNPALPSSKVIFTIGKAMDGTVQRISLEKEERKRKRSGTHFMDEQTKT